MAQIFLSYARKDAAAAKTIASALSDNGHVVWWDTHIGGGSKFAVEIERALAAAEIVIVLWSNDAIRSAWVLDEAAEGRDTGRLLPVALDGSKPPLGFRQFQTIAADARLEAALDEVLTAIARRSGGSGETSGSAERARSAAPNTTSHCAKARDLQQRGQFGEAWTEIEAALETDPTCALANREAAWFLYVQGRAADAIPFYERAAASSRSDHESAAMLISCYRATKDELALNRAAAIAIARAEQSIAAAASSGAAFASGAKGLAALGHRERARKWVRKALNLDPGNLPMRYNLASTLAQFMQDGEAAIDVLEPFVEATRDQVHLQLLEGDPDWAELRETRAFQTLLGRARKRVAALETTGFAGHSSA